MRTEHPTGTDRRARRTRLAELMARLPDDPAAEVTLYVEFGDELRRALVAIVRDHDLPPIEPAELDGLAFDACGELATIARWWRPDGGALPWVYGRARLLALLRRHVGPRARPLPDRPVEGATAPMAVAPDDPPAILVLDRLVDDGGDPVLVTLRDALHRSVPERDVELVLLYLQQQAADDRSPSHTVGRLVGRQPAAVRQSFSRARRRLRALALTDHGFRPLLALPFLADQRRAA